MTKDVGIAAGLGQQAVIADTVVAQLARARGGLPKGADHSEAIRYGAARKV